MGEPGGVGEPGDEGEPSREDGSVRIPAVGVDPVARARGIGLPGHMDLVVPVAGPGAHPSGSEVWFGRDRRRGRDIVVKVHEGPGIARRVEREARALTRLASVAPAAAAVAAVPVAVGARGGDLAWITTDRVRGSTLYDLLGSGPVAPHDLLAWTGRLAGGLAGAHRAGVVHGDVTPHNIVVADHGGVVLVDFGSAGIDGTAARGGHTPRWAAPERRAGAMATPASDVYGLVASMVDGLDPDDLPWRLRRLVRRALSPSPRRRPPAAALARRIGCPP